MDQTCVVIREETCLGCTIRAEAAYFVFLTLQINVFSFGKSFIQ